MIVVAKFWGEVLLVRVDKVEGDVAIGTVLYPASQKPKTDKGWVLGGSKPKKKKPKEMQRPQRTLRPGKTVQERVDIIRLALPKVGAVQASKFINTNIKGPLSGGQVSRILEVGEKSGFWKVNRTVVPWMMELT